MVKAGDVLEHPVTGEKIVFRQTAEATNGELMKVDFSIEPHGFVAAEHVHPVQEERFEVISGEVTFSVQGVQRKVHSGEIVTIPPGTPHNWWNSSAQEAQLVVEVRPALQLAEFFETFFGLAQAGKVDKKTGLPSLLMMAVILREFNREIRLAQPPAPVQKILFGVLAQIGHLRGYKARYPYPR